jgi:hypothetical protein
MKVHEPDWVGEVLQCEKCSTQFTLEANDEKLVKFIGKFPNRRARYSIKCPKRRKRLVFSVDKTKER